MAGTASDLLPSPFSDRDTPTAVQQHWTCVGIGQVMAASSKARGAFRDAHSKLAQVRHCLCLVCFQCIIVAKTLPLPCSAAQHAESIISFNGVAAEARRLDDRLGEH